MIMKAVILAGGSGERFWPMSTSEQPKQFLKLFGDRSLIRQTFDRLKFRIPPEDIIIVTSDLHIDLTRKEIPELTIRNMIGEHRRMNTAPACAVGSMLADPDEIVLTVPADHLIPETEKFWDLMDIAIEGLNEHGGLFTFGIRPDRPETGYGYIGLGRSLMEGIHEVRSFREKPDLKTANEFLSSGRFLWNSGMFLWKAGELLSEMERCCPLVIEPFRGIDPRNKDQMKKAYNRTEQISIDNAVMERSSKVRVVPTDIIWSDVGSWESMKEIDGGSKESPRLSLEGSKNVLVRSETGRRIAIVGLSDIIVVDTPDGLLVLDPRSSQKVRKVSKYFQ